MKDWNDHIKENTHLTAEEYCEKYNGLDDNGNKTHTLARLKND